MSDLLARAAELAGIDGPYVIDPSVKVSQGSFNSDRLMLTFERRMTLAEIEPTLRRLAMPEDAFGQMAALLSDAWHLLLGDDGTTKRVYLELTGGYKGWKWNPTTGEWHLTEYPEWGPPYGPPSPLDDIMAAYAMFLTSRVGMASWMATLLGIAKDNGATSLYSHRSTEDGVLHAIYTGLPGGASEYIATLDAVCRAYGIAEETFLPILQQLRGSITVAAGLDYLTVYHGQLFVPAIK